MPFMTQLFIYPGFEHIGICILVVITGAYNSQKDK